MDEARTRGKHVVDLVLLQVADHVPGHIGEGRVVADGLKLAGELLRAVLAKVGIAGGTGSRHLGHVYRFAHRADADFLGVTSCLKRGLAHPLENLGAALPHLGSVIGVYLSTRHV